MVNGDRGIVIGVFEGNASAKEMEERRMMPRMIAGEVWKQRTVRMAISIFRLMRLMNANGDVELRFPPRRCAECGKLAEVVVVPDQRCGNCWSRGAIAAWRVPPRAK